jgi:hypothetical protein
MPRGDGPFNVLSGINGNAYKIELPGDYGVSPTFNVTDLSPFLGDEETESRVTPLQEREEDAEICTKHTTSTKNQGQVVSSNINQGTLTQSRAKKLQQQMTSLLAEFDNNVSENVVLPKGFMLIILRFKPQGEEYPHVEQERDYMDSVKKIEHDKFGPPDQTTLSSIQTTTLN